MESALNQIRQLGQTENTTILQKTNGFIEIEASGVYIAEAIHYRAIQLGLVSKWNGTNVQVSVYGGGHHENDQESEPPEEGSVHNSRAD
jgi:hypothetical protein